MTRLRPHERRAIERVRDEWLERVDACEMLSKSLLGRVDAAIAGAPDRDLKARFAQQRIALEDCIHDHLEGDAAHFRRLAAEAAEPLGEDERREMRADYYAGLGVR